MAHISLSLEQRKLSQLSLILLARFHCVFFKETLFPSLPGNNALAVTMKIMHGVVQPLSTSYSAARGKFAQ